MRMVHSGSVAVKSASWRVGGVIARDALDVGREPRVQHLIGLIEHDEAKTLQVQVALTEVIQHTAGRADHDLGSGEQRLTLRPEWTAADELSDTQAASAVE